MKQTWLPSSPKVASPRKKQSGFTLAELLIAVSIATFVLTGAISMFIQFSKTNLSMAARSEFDRQMRTTLQRISSDTRVAANASVTGNSNIALTMPAGTNPQNIYYQYNAKTQELMRAEETGDFNMVLSNVSNFSVKQSGDTVSYYINFSKDVGDRNITLDRDVSFRMRN